MSASRSLAWVSVREVVLIGSTGTRRCRGHPPAPTRDAHRRREAVDVVGAVVAPAVDEERRRAGDAAEVGAVDVVGDLRGADARTKVVCELLDVEPELLRVPDQVIRLQGVLVPEQQVVHLPERALRGCGLRCFGGELRVRMHVVQRKMAPYVADVSGEVPEQLAHDRLRLTAERTLEVAVLHN